MNINDKSQKRACTSCQICGAVCPVGAISIDLNKDGFYRPVVDGDKCIDCGLCVKSCYKFDNDISITADTSSIQLFSAWAKDTSVVANTTSGGIAVLLAGKLIESGYTCIGVAYDTVTNSAVGRVATTLEDTEAFRGSKYIQSLSVDAFKSLVKNHRNDKYAVFGLPCQIYAIDRYLREKGERDKHLLIDLYCHGCPSLNLWQKYVAGILRKTEGTGVISANFRSKIRGWGNFYVAEVSVNRANNPIKVVSPRVNDEFYTMFFSDMVLNDSCYDCKLRSTLDYTDLRLGDFWGDKFVHNRKGVSAVTVCTARGMALFDSISGQIEYEKQNFGAFIRYQSYGRDYGCNTSARERLLDMLADKDTSLKDVVANYKKSLPLKNRIILEGKNVVKLLPLGLIAAIKRLVYKLRNK